MYKVCHVTSVHPRYDIRIFQKECRSLAEAGFKVYLVVADEMKNVVVDNVHVVSTKKKYRNRKERFINGSKDVYKIARKVDADIYHIHDPELLPIALKLHKNGKKVIFDSHEFTAKQILYKPYLKKGIKNIVSKIYEIYERYVLRKLDAVIIPALYDGQDYFKGNYKRQEIINNVPIVPKDEQSVPKDERSNSICYIGAITEERGAKVMMEAAYLADVKLILGGDFIPAGLKEDMQKSKAYRNVDYRGYVKGQEKEQIMQQCIGGVCLLQNNDQYQKAGNLATKVYEYMCYGLPVIVSDFPYVKEVLNEYKFGLAVNPENKKEIAKAIQYLKNHPEEVGQMGREGRRAIEEKFNWEMESKKLILLYKDILKG